VFVEQGEQVAPELQKCVPIEQVGEQGEANVDKRAAKRMITR
jgi:hypothetical protein